MVKNSKDLSLVYRILRICLNNQKWLYLYKKSNIILLAIFKKEENRYSYEKK